MESYQKKLVWREISSSKVKTFQLEDEPELLHIIKIRDNEYMVVYEDAYDLDTGTLVFYNKETIKNKFNINLD
jgi:hypothetical protein